MIGNMNIGFTGRRDGLSQEQHNALDKFLFKIKKENFNTITTIQGGCIGADEQFYHLSKVYDMYRITYPGHSAKDNTSLSFDYSDSNEIAISKTYFERNRNIVNDSYLMVACPYGDDFNKSGGTNYTINYSIKQGKKIYIILPDGKIINK